MTIETRSLGIAILVALALALLLVSGLHMAQVITHALAASGASPLADSCGASITHC